jgi:hypothetical protein
MRGESALLIKSMTAAPERRISAQRCGHHE